MPCINVTHNEVDCETAGIELEEINKEDLTDEEIDRWNTPQCVEDLK